MMAFVFFLLWMLASLALLTVWVFRQSPPTTRETARTLSTSHDATPVEG
jgi:hypothetical protein